MKLTTDTICDGVQASQERKFFYSAPVLRPMGDVRDLTLGGSMGNPDSIDQGNTLRQ